MAYTQFDKILAAHYNTFVAGDGTFGIVDHNTANINTVWGEGNNDKGYGQSTVLSQVPVGTVVSATQWSTMITRMLAAGDHQVTALGDMPGDGGAGGPAIIGGDLIVAITAMQNNVDDLFANRLNAIATAATQAEVASGSDPWPAESVHTINVQFTSGNAARYFFNAGGNIAITLERNGGAANGKNDSWDDGSSGAADHGILPNSGSIELSAHGNVKSGGFGTLNTDYFIESAIGYYELGTSAIQTYQQFAIGGGVYGTNNAMIEVATNGTVGAAGDNGDLITFTVTMTDDAADPPSVDGTTLARATVNFPATTYLTEASWGAVTFVPASSVVQT